MTNSLITIATLVLLLVATASASGRGKVPVANEFVRVAADGWHFETLESRTPFVPFGGVYYDPETYTDEPYPRFLVITGFDEERTDRHFGQIAGIGANIVRITLSTKVFSPEYRKTDEQAFRTLDRIIALAKKHGLRVILDPFVEWEGQAPWTQPSGERFSDERMLRGFEFLYAAFAERYRDEPTVFAFLICDEPRLPWTSRSMTEAWGERVRKQYGSEDSLKRAWADYPRPGERWEHIRPAEDENKPGSRRLYDYQVFREDIAARFVERMAGAIRSKDKRHMISLGNLQWVAPMRRRLTEDLLKPSSYPAFNPAKIGMYLSYTHINCYDWWDDRTPKYGQALGRYSYYPGKPVILGEFSFDRKLVEQTRGTFAGYSAWAFYPLPSEPTLNYLFDKDGNLTPHGKAFRETAELIRAGKLTLDRAKDEDTLVVDSMKALTDVPSTVEVYDGYMEMAEGGKVVGLRAK